MNNNKIKRQKLGFVFELIIFLLKDNFFIIIIVEEENHIVHYIHTHWVIITNPKGKKWILMWIDQSQSDI